MSDRVTRKHVENVFAQLVKRMTEHGAAAGEGHHYALNYSSYGGYEIVIVEEPNGAQSNPFGHTRRNAREMVSTMRFALDVLYRVETDEEK